MFNISSSIIYTQNSPRFLKLQPVWRWRKVLIIYPDMTDLDDEITGLQKFLWNVKILLHGQIQNFKQIKLGSLELLHINFPFRFGEDPL